MYRTGSSGCFVSVHQKHGIALRRQIEVIGQRKPFFFHLNGTDLIHAEFVNTVLSLPHTAADHKIAVHIPNQRVGTEFVSVAIETQGLLPFSVVSIILEGDLFISVYSSIQPIGHGQSILIVVL